MKRLLAVLISAIMLTAAGCSSTTPTAGEQASGVQASGIQASGVQASGAQASGVQVSEAEAPAVERLNIVTTIFAPYDFSRQIVGDKADITMLLPPASESHSFEPTPQDVIKIQDCDVFIYVGGESDAWVGSILDSMDTSKMTVLTLMDCVEIVEEEVVEGMQAETHDHEGEATGHEGEAGHESEAALHECEAGHESEVAGHENEAGYEGEEALHEPVYDEHVWTSPRNAKLIVKKISDAIVARDAANAQVFTANTEAYLAKLDELDATFREVVDGGTRKTIVFGDRFPFRYFTDAYNLTYSAAFVGCSTETDASAATVKYLIDKINAEKIPVVFHIELGNFKMANTISEETGAKSLLFHACHNITRDDFVGGKTYIDLMKNNVEALREALR